jgi:hypothetical protein
MPYFHRDPHSYWVYGVYSCSTHQILQLNSAIDILPGGGDTTKTWTQWKFVPESIKVVYWSEIFFLILFFIDLRKLPKNFEFSRQYTTLIDSGTNFWHRQERDRTIVQTTHEWNDQEVGGIIKNGTTIVLVIPFFIIPFLSSRYCVCRIFTAFMFSL